MDLKQFRIDYKLSQSDLADVFGCKQSNISLIENGARALTGLQIRLLIEKYGFENVAKYADNNELPAQVTVNVPHVSTNNGQINGGGGNTQVNNDKSLVDALNRLIDQQAEKDKQISDLIAQQSRLISLLENKQ